MSAEPADEPSSDQVRTYLAGERTLLAWTRTAISMMGFGFLIARFGLFLQELALVHQRPAPASTGWSLWIGTTLVIAAAAVCLFSVIQHVQFLRSLRHPKLAQPGRSWFEIGLTLLLGLLGILLAIYLVATRP